MDNHPIRTSDPEGFPSVAAWMQERRRRWGDFCHDLASSAGVTVLDGQLYHECVDSLLYYDIPIEDIRAFVEELEELTQHLQPALVYLFQSDVGAAIRKVFTERGEGWSQWQIDWKVHNRPMAATVDSPEWTDSLSCTPSTAN